MTRSGTDPLPPSRRPQRRTLVVVGSAALVAAIAAVVAINRPDGAHPTTRSAAPSPQQTAAQIDLRQLVSDTPCPAPKGAHFADRAEIRAFPAVAAVTCSWGRRIYSGEGEWSVWIRKASADGITALKDALDQPDIPHPNRPVGCLAVLISAPPLAFVAADGSYLVPSYPIDHTCEQPLATAMSAVTDHTWSRVGVTRDKQLRTADEVTFGCADGLGSPFGGKYSTSSMPLSPGGPVFTRYPDEQLSVCIYRVDRDPVAGHFVRGLQLDSSDSAQLRNALTGPGVANEGCPPQDEFALIHAERGDLVLIELGGCWRLHRDDRPTTLGTADGATVSRLLQRG